MDFLFWDIVPSFEKHSGKLKKAFWKVEEDFGCPACKLGIWSIQAFNNGVTRWVTAQSFTLICEIIMPFVKLSPSMCSGVIQDQYTEFLYPLIWDEILSEHTFCTFIMELCEMDKWKPVDVNEWVFNKVNEKPEIA